jgi:tetrahydromethanopterin S-methyltransferase subunit C
MEAFSDERPIPGLHAVMIGVTCGILALAMALYFFAPAEKAPTYLMIITACLGFLFGKFTNSFRGG